MSSDFARFLRAYRRFLEHAVEAAGIQPDELRRMRESEVFFFVGNESAARREATESLGAVRSRVEAIADRETLHYALGLILEAIERSMEQRRVEARAVERTSELESEVARLRKAHPRLRDEPPPPFFRPDRPLVELCLATVPRRYLRRALTRSETEAATDADDPAAAIAALHAKQLRRRAPKEKAARRRWTELDLPAPDRLDAVLIDRFARRISGALTEALAGLAEVPPPRDAWGWTGRDLARALARDLGLGALATRALVRSVFTWLQRDAGTAYRFPWGSIHLVERRRLVIEPIDRASPPERPLAELIDLLGAPR